jgi:hypothetical protein
MNLSYKANYVNIRFYSLQLLIWLEIAFQRRLDVCKSLLGHSKGLGSLKHLGLVSDNTANMQSKQSR